MTLLALGNLLNDMIEKTFSLLKDCIEIVCKPVQFLTKGLFFKDTEFGTTDFFLSFGFCFSRMMKARALGSEV